MIDCELETEAPQIENLSLMEEIWFRCVGPVGECGYYSKVTENFPVNISSQLSLKGCGCPLST